MRKGDLLFVYGTLRRGEAMDLSKPHNLDRVRFLTEDRVNGAIYDLGSYPGLEPFKNKRFNPEYSTVTGDVFEILDDSVVFSLDSYEGYPHLYDRRVLSSEEGRDVWVYTYNGRMPESRMIDGGDWKSRRGETNLRFDRKVA